MEKWISETEYFHGIFLDRIKFRFEVSSSYSQMASFCSSSNAEVSCCVQRSNGVIGSVSGSGSGNDWVADICTERGSADGWVAGTCNQRSVDRDGRLSRRPDSRPRRRIVSEFCTLDI